MVKTTTTRTGRGKTNSAATRESVHYCAERKVEPRALPPDLHPGRLRLIRENEKKWANGTVLHYYFFDDTHDGVQGSWIGPESQREVVRRAFQAWKDLGIGLQFQEVQDRAEAEVRIGFDQSDGSWSYVGRDVIDLAGDPDERTMNFGWDLTTDYGWDTALHEIGHTLGFPHAHQNPFAGIEWDEPAVLDYFAGAPNFWQEDVTRWNVLRKLTPSAVEGSQWDPDSIMQYWFPAGLIRSPEKYVNGLEPEPGISDSDKQWVKRFYPPLARADDRILEPFYSQRLTIGAGEQKNFIVRPGYSREYTLQTFGRSDTVMVLFELMDGAIRYVGGDDDSGFDRNSKIRARLYRGSEYVLRVRLYYSQMSGESAVLMY